MSSFTPFERQAAIIASHSFTSKPSAFRKDVFPRFGGGDRLLGVQVDRRCDVDSVDLIVRDQFAPIRGPFFCTEFSGKTLRQLTL